MGAALLGENIITEAQNVLLKGIHELEGYLHLHPVDGAFIIDWIVNWSLSGVQFLYVRDDSLRLMEQDGLLLTRSLILICDLKIGI